MTLDTLAAPAEFVLEVKKSRFLALGFPLGESSDAGALLREHSDSDATHNCWAWRFAADYRSSDDGEPGGTAGRPILAAIDQQGFDRVLVLVTRWYGGINLGTGGLARAYGGSAAECLRKAQRQPLVASLDCLLACDFALAGAVHRLIASLGAEKLAASFEEGGLRLRLRLPAAMYPDLERRLRDLSRGAATLTLFETENA